jgi:hypothetical protein
MLFSVVRQFRRAAFSFCPKEIEMAVKRLGSGSGPERKEGATRLTAGKHRRVQIARTGGRKLFGAAAQKVFLEWFAATCNLSWSAEMAGFNYKTVLRHRMNDARFREGWERAVEQGYARLEAQQLETKKREVPIGIEGDWDAPEMDPMDPQLALAILRERKREVKHPEMVRRQGRRPRVASNAEVKAALEKRLKAFYVRERARLGREEGEIPPRDGEGDRGAQRRGGGGSAPEPTPPGGAPPPPPPLHHPAAPDGPPPRPGEDL